MLSALSSFRWVATGSDAGVRCAYVTYDSIDCR
jgi:hypothetical protein